MNRPKKALADEDPANFIPYESPRLTTQNRYEDEPEPTEDDQIKTHYLKHHPLYEFRNFEEFHVDPYRHWLHGRVDYLNTETYPGEISPWERGSKLSHSIFILMPFFAFFFLGNGYKEHCKQKNVKMPIIGVFSQSSIWAKQTHGDHFSKRGKGDDKVFLQNKTNLQYLTI